MGITEFVESPGYKKVMGKVYGIGASVVILGALWKILHLPGAAGMLIAGLGTEAVIFFLSAFEPPHEMPDWSLVYPELIGLESKGAHGVGGGGGGSELQALIQTGNIDQKTVSELSDGIKRLGATSSQLADLSDASLATQSYLQNIQNASESVGKFGNVQAKSAQVIEESSNILAGSYAATASVISESGTKVANELVQSGKVLTNEMQKSGESLSTAYSDLNATLKQDIQGISENGKKYNEKLSEVNGNLAAINSIYELQLKGSKAQVEVSEEVTSGLSEIKDYFKQSVEDAKIYRDQVSQLNKTVGELNTIYGNMLSAMNVGGNR
jgi:gliding motility-associated protein GldL